MNARRRVLAYLAIMGPGLIAAQVGNDAGGIATYSLAGSEYGYQLLWALVLASISLWVIQEMAVRMGAVTGKGLAALIRENFGLRLTMFCMATLLFANLATTISEFAGMAAAFEIFGLNRLVTVPLTAMAVWLLVVRGSYRSVEKVFIAIASLYLTYILVGFIAKPDWSEVLSSTIHPKISGEINQIALIIAMVGTTVAPWMQFFLQSSIVDKKLSVKDLSLQRVDVATGIIASSAVAFFIIIATAATLFANGQTVETAADAARALQPLAGVYAGMVFALGLLGASMLAACIIPLTTSFVLCEAFGWEAGIDRSFREAPIFISIYSLSILFGALLVLIPTIPLLKVMLFAQTVNGILLPILLVFMVIMVNDKTLMGKHANRLGHNLIAWATVIGLVGLTMALLWFSILG